MKPGTELPFILNLFLDLLLPSDVVFAHVEAGDPIVWRLMLGSPTVEPWIVLRFIVKLLVYDIHVRVDIWIHVLRFNVLWIVGLSLTVDR